MTSVDIAAGLTDAFGRRIRYLRLSVTDRCNLRCRYCMGGDVTFLPKREILTLEEMLRVSEVFVRLGVVKVRVTGGEPLARPGVVGLIERLGALLDGGGLEELTLTTNGILLARHASALQAAGVRRVNVSLDTLDASRFQAITGHDGLAQVLAGIEAVRALGIAVRLNTVVQGGVNDDELDRLVAWSGGHGCDMALIECMPMKGAAAGPALLLDAVRDRLAERWTLQPLSERSTGPADYCRVVETGQRLGFIAPMSHGFCPRCNRVRLTCSGRLVLCLGQDHGVDLRPALREQTSDAALEDAIRAAIASKPPRHHFAASGQTAETAAPMWQMGG
ncbi:GTP 3',8-cyclase MoaA [Paludibacterium sp.]|uniref:GTP 3',8-cyclase MoaA n=1 Tax=Paludibacterium sp. TaxID=1917523 RepID=UPI0025D519FA|nr:GTP 3',8-cyclase MoaA [Paludibacterium sp.]MBV8646110.1 GTP 3',8-cyclase MoaA [Paludibacterium sp.]